MCCSINNRNLTTQIKQEVKKTIDDKEDSPYSLNPKVQNVALSVFANQDVSIETPFEVNFPTSFQEPKIWYPVQTNSEGKIEMAVPPQIKCIKNVIYIFKNSVSGWCWISRNKQKFVKTLSYYEGHFNLELPSSQQQSRRNVFFANVRANPSHFQLGILCEANSTDNLKKLESIFIKNWRQHYSIYSDKVQKKKGGARHYPIRKGNETSLTPEKYYPFKRTNEKIVAQFTPTLEEKVKKQIEESDEMIEFVYYIKNLKTGQRYIGVTRDPKKRVSQHASKAAEHDPMCVRFKAGLSTGYLYPAMGRNPEDFAVGVLDIPLYETIDPSQEDDFIYIEGIGFVEKYLIELKQSLHNQNGLNGNRGGGGRGLGQLSRKRKVSFESPIQDAQTLSKSRRRQFLQGSEMQNLSFDNDGLFY